MPITRDKLQQQSKAAQTAPSKSAATRLATKLKAFTAKRK